MIRVSLLFCRASLLAGDKLLDVSQDPREAHIHTFNSVGKLDVVLPLLCFLFNVVAGARVIRELAEACKSVEHVTHGNVDSLTEDAVAILTIGEHLSVAAGDVENCRVLSPRDHTSHLDMTDAVVHTD